MTTDGHTWLKPAQVDEMRNACFDKGARNKHRNAAIIALLYDTGLRPTELVDVTTGMLDPDDGVLRIPGGIQKEYPNDSSPRAVTIELEQDEFTDDTVRALQAHLNNRASRSSFLFPTPHSDGITTRSLRYMVESIADRAGIEPYVGQSGRGDPADVIPYSFRHSIAYRILEARDEPGTIYDVKRRLRHVSIGTTDKFYSHFDSV